MNLRSTHESGGAGASDRRGLALAFASIVLAMLPAVLDQTILATALPVIAEDLGSLADISWVVTAYVVAAAATAPLWGKLGDRLGRKRLLQLTLAAFVTSSALCGLAQDITELIGLRAAQGAAAGGLMALAMAAVGDLVSPRERGRYQGYIAAAFATATVAGPLLGGLLVDGASWRWVFLVEPAGRHRRAHGADAASAGRLRSSALSTVSTASAPLCSTAAAGTLVLVAIWGGDRYPWDSSPILALIAATALLAAGLFVRERRVPDPIVPLRMLGSRAVGLVSATLFLALAAMFSITVFVPLFLQTTTGASPTEAGLFSPRRWWGSPSPRRSREGASRGPDATSAFP